ncbi:MAG TPA: hypothetical protein DET40_21815 [Lentisphaeria bacterium]|nr:MAG: hypothetical protein A2X45_14160 [Lentisphaerae bacterium GWF2_50_93]HCE46191.1 hypothetical protein [Lentisphaeria bacterium]
MKKTGKGHLFQRDKDSKGNPAGNYYLQYTINKERKIVSLGTANLKAAKQKRDDILNPALTAKTKEDVVRHIAEARALMSNVSLPLDKVWNHFTKIPTGNKKMLKFRPDSGEGTLSNYERFFRHFCNWLKDKYPNITKINEVTSKEAEEYMTFLWTNEEHEITANTFNYHLQGLRLVFSRVCKSFNTPFDDVSRQDGKQIKRKNFTVAQLKSLFEAIDNPECDISNRSEMKLLCHIGRWTGLRLCDAVLMKWKQIDFIANKITAEPIKTKNIHREVNIPIHSELKSQLDRAESAGGEYVLPVMAEIYNRNPDEINKDFATVLDKAKLTEVVTAKRGRDRRAYGFHSFRHSFASFAANAGIPISALSDILGDNARTLEKYYIKASDENKAKAIESQSQPQLTTGNDTEEVIDVKPIDELVELQKRVSDALELIRTATKKDISEAFTAQLVKILQPQI